MLWTTLLMTRQYLKQGFWCIIVLYVLIDPRFSLTEGCPVVSKKNWVPHDCLHVWLEMLLNQVFYVALELVAKHIG